MVRNLLATVEERCGFHVTPLEDSAEAGVGDAETPVSFSKARRTVTGISTHEPYDR